MRASSGRRRPWMVTARDWGLSRSPAQAGQVRSAMRASRASPRASWWVRSYSWSTRRAEPGPGGLQVVHPRGPAPPVVPVHLEHPLPAAGHGHFPLPRAQVPPGTGVVQPQVPGRRAQDRQVAAVGLLQVGAEAGAVQGPGAQDPVRAVHQPLGGHRPG